MRFICCLSLLAMVEAGSLAAATSNPTEAVIRFLEVRIMQDPDDFPAVEKLGKAYLQRARESGDIDSYPKAERLFRNVLKWTPESYPLRVSLASTLVSQHKFREAAALAGKLTLEAPGEAPAFAVVGDALLEIGDIKGAESAYARLLGLAPSLSAYARVARVDWFRGNVAAALSNFSSALQFTNSPPETLAWAHVQKGALLFRAGQPMAAEVEYKRALEALPDYFSALDHHAELLAARGQWDDAAKSFQRLAERTGRPEYWQAVGDVLVAAKRSAEAKPFHDRALEAYLKQTEAGNVHYFHHLANFYADVREDGTEAERWARRDLEVRQNIYAWDALAWALYWKKEYPAAVEAMQKALALGTKDAHLLAHAGSIFLRAQKIREGREFMKKAAEVNPEYQGFHVHR